MLQVVAIVVVVVALVVLLQVVVGELHLNALGSYLTVHAASSAMNAWNLYSL